ncbi:hypothetical protein LXA43DRAFT_1090978 [Ganoderma leucocontextum]|nr:hypothetical protein LXA43DRAFT_1090978 [Ganoderma leucocontextum]
MSQNPLSAIVALHDDLYAFISGFGFFRHRVNPIHTFDELAAVIRLAHKYNVPQVQDQALPHIALKPAHSIGVINLACLTDMPSLLSVAFYDCAHRGSALLDGWTHEDGTVEHLSDADLR